MLRRLFAAAGLALALGTLAIAAQATKPSDKVPTNIYKRSVKSTVWIYNRVTPTTGRTGSGTLIDVKDRLILTNYHVVDEDNEVFVFFPIMDKTGNLNNDRKAYTGQITGGKAPNGKVIAREPKRDLALIQLDAVAKDATAVRLAKNGVGPADPIHCIGNSGISNGLFDYCPGSVRNVANTRVRPKGASFELNCRTLEHTAPIAQGQSGGPVLNDAGELVGVTQGVASNNMTSISIAIELSEVKEFLKGNKYARLLTAPQTTVAANSESPKTTVPAAATEIDPKALAAQQEQTAAFKLSTAKEFIKEGKKDKARERLEDIVKSFPATKAADEAKTLLEQLRN